MPRKLTVVNFLTLHSASAASSPPMHLPTRAAQAPDVNENLKLNPDNDLDEAVQQVLEVEVVPDGLVVALDRVRIFRARLPIAPVVPQQEAGQ
jgi:hypothetical protein